MIIGENRKAVIENIKSFAESGQFHNKVEPGDPVLTAEQSKQITDNFIECRKHITYKIKTAFGVLIAKTATRIINKDTKINYKDVSLFTEFTFNILKLLDVLH